MYVCVRLNGYGWWCSPEIQRIPGELDMKQAFLSLSSMAYSVLLGPVFYGLWTYSGAGNANFFYAITLNWGLAQVILVTDSAFAYLRREWERLHPDLRQARVELVHQ